MTTTTSNLTLVDLLPRAVDDAERLMRRGDWVELRIDARRSEHPITLDHGTYTPLGVLERSIETIQYHWTGHRVKTVHP